MLLSGREDPVQDFFQPILRCWRAQANSGFLFQLQQAYLFWGQELLVQFISLAASPPTAETCTLVPRAFFPSLSLFYVFSWLFFFLNV